MGAVKPALAGGPPPTGEMKRPLFRQIFSFEAMLGAGLVVVAASTVCHRISDPDLWWHLKVGQIIWTTHAIPTRDTFSFTTGGHAWAAHEWLAQLSIYGAYAAAGYRGLIAWLIALASAIFLVSYALCWRVSRNSLVAFLGG